MVSSVTHLIVDTGISARTVAKTPTLGLSLWPEFFKSWQPQIITWWLRASEEPVGAASSFIT